MNHEQGNGFADSSIVVGVDGSAHSELALRWAVDTALGRRRPLHIVHGLGLTPFGTPYASMAGVLDAIRAGGAAILDDAVATARVLGAIDPTSELTDGRPVQRLLELSRAAQLVVVGAPAVDAVTRVVLGSVAGAVAAEADGNVVVVHGDSSTMTYRSDGPVVVGVDGGPTSDDAIAAAFEEASIRHAPLTAVHVWSDLSMKSFASRPSIVFDMVELETAENAVLAERLAGWQEKYPDVAVTRETYMTGPREHLITQSRTAQLVVVGSRGRGGCRGMLLGSTSSALVNHAGCPVLVAHRQS